jgi:hypothetical protein
MSLFDRLFGTASSADQPQLRFGRYTDSYKTPEQYAAWDQALEAFESEAFLESYRQFFQYLRDESEDNVRIRKKSPLSFLRSFRVPNALPDKPPRSASAPKPGWHTLTTCTLASCAG